MISNDTATRPYSCDDFLAKLRRCVGEVNDRDLALTMIS